MALKPGDKLLWRKPRTRKGWYKAEFDRWRENHGEEVEFVAYAKKGEDYVLHTHDPDGLPILLVRTKVGIVAFSSGHFIFPSGNFVC